MAQAAYDVDPDLGKSAQYMRNSMSVAGYSYLLAVGKLTDTLAGEGLGHASAPAFTAPCRHNHDAANPLQSSHTY